MGTGERILLQPGNWQVESLSTVLMCFHSSSRVCSHLNRQTRLQIRSLQWAAMFLPFGNSKWHIQVTQFTDALLMLLNSFLLSYCILDGSHCFVFEFTHLFFCDVSSAVKPTWCIFHLGCVVFMLRSSVWVFFVICLRVSTFLIMCRTVTVTVLSPNPNVYIISHIGSNFPVSLIRC